MQIIENGIDEDVYRNQLHYDVLFPILGIPVKFRSNSRKVIECIRNAFGHWDILSEDLVNHSTELTVDIIRIEDTNNQKNEKFYFDYSINSDFIFAVDGENVFRAEMPQGKAAAYVTESLITNEPVFVWYVIEGLALSLVTWEWRVPFHASAVTIENHAIAFIGKSGAGKSSLAYACLRKGFNLLSEDTIFVGTESDYRIWGNATKIHLLPDAVNLFPELKMREPILRPNGKIKIPIHISEIKNSNFVLQVPTVTVCLIEPNYGIRESKIEEVSPQYVRDSIMDSLEPGFDQFIEKSDATLERLLHCKTFRLFVGNEIDNVTDLLLKIL